MQTLDQICVNEIRFLADDAVVEGHSGHPGLLLGASQWVMSSVIAICDRCGPSALRGPVLLSHLLFDRRHSRQSMNSYLYKSLTGGY